MVVVGVSDTGVGRSILHHTLAENYELDITNDRNAAPSHRGGPEGCMVGHPARDGREVRVR